MDRNNIINNLDSYICKIIINKTDFEYGFLCKIPYPDKYSSFIHVLITTNKIAKKKLFIISFGNDKVKKMIFYQPERKIYRSEKYNTLIIEIFPDKDDIHNFLEFEENINIENDIKNKDLSICVPYFSIEQGFSIYYWGINKNGTEFDTIKEVCSGCPVILLDTLKVIGMIDGKMKDINILKYAIFEFNKNEIIIKIKIEEYDLNKNVYILNCPDYTNIDGVTFKNKELKKINESNIKMFIDDE